MSQHSPRREEAVRPDAARRDHRDRSAGSQNAPAAADLVATGRIPPQQAYAATLVLARLHDRGAALYMTIEEMCEVLGYLGDGRRPKAVPKNRVAPMHTRRPGSAPRSEAS